MDTKEFFKNGDPSEPRLNAEGSFKNDFQGSFADEQKMEFAHSEEPKFGLTREERLDALRGSEQGAKANTDDVLKAQLEAQSNNKISTGAWIAIGVSVVVVFGGLGYILYKKYK